jgi:hypothetical protein
LGFQPLPPNCRAVFLSVSISKAGEVTDGGRFVRIAAITPAATGQDAEVPVSGRFRPAASDP